MAKQIDGTMPVTFNLDDDVSLSVQPLIMALRRNGFKGVSRTFLLNSSLRKMLKEFKEDGLEGVQEIIKEDYEFMITKRKK